MKIIILIKNNIYIYINILHKIKYYIILIIIKNSYYRNNIVV